MKQWAKTEYYSMRRLCFVIIQLFVFLSTLATAAMAAASCSDYVVNLKAAESSFVDSDVYDTEGKRLEASLQFEAGQHHFDVAMTYLNGCTSDKELIWYDIALAHRAILSVDLNDRKSYFFSDAKEVSEDVAEFASVRFQKHNPDLWPILRKYNRRLQLLVPEMRKEDVATRLASQQEAAKSRKDAETAQRELAAEKAIGKQEEITANGYITSDNPTIKRVAVFVDEEKITSFSVYVNGEMYNSFGSEVSRFRDENVKVLVGLYRKFHPNWDSTTHIRIDFRTDLEILDTETEYAPPQ